MDADGSNLRRLTDRVGYDGGPWFSPDGKKIVWRAWYPESPGEETQWRECMEKNYILPVALDLWIMDADGSNKTRILHNGATNFAPSWHPDGRRIIFASNMDDWHADIGKYGHNFELYLINIDGTGLERITFNKVFDSFPMFSSDGRKLVLTGRVVRRARTELPSTVPRGFGFRLADEWPDYEDLFRPPPDKDE